MVGGYINVSVFDIKEHNIWLRFYFHFDFFFIKEEI